MATSNEIEFKVKVTDQGLAPLAATLDRVDQKTDELGKSAATTGKQLDGMGTQADRADQKTDQLGKSAATTGKQLDGIGQQLRGVANSLAALAGVNIGVGLIKDVAATADQYSNLAARIKLATGEGENFERGFEGVQQIAQQTSSALENTGILFTRLAEAGKSAGQGAQQATSQALELTESINQAVQLSGASAASSDAAIQQLIQGLQSGVLRGEEFNSIMEQAPRLARALTDGLGVTTGELRKMSNEGRLTTEVVIGAIKSQAATLKSEFETLPPTVGRAVQNLATAWTLYVGEADKATGASRTAAQAIDLLTQNLGTVIDLAIVAGETMAVVWGIKALTALRAYSAGLAVAAAETSALMATTTAAGATMAAGLVAAAKVAAAGWVGWEVGTYLRNEFDEVEKAGIAMAAGLTKAAALAQGSWEVAQAAFTDDTIDAAQQRLAQRIQQIDDEYADMFANVGAALPQLAADTLAVGDAAEQAGNKVRISSADIVEAFEAAAIAKRGDAVAAVANLEVQLKLAQQSEQMALYLGNEYEARQAKILQMQIEIQIINAKVQVQKAEAEGTIAVAQAKLAELAASGQMSLVKQAELEASIKLAQAKIAEANATGQSTELLKKQLEALRNGTSAADGYGSSLKNLSGSQQGLAASTTQANAALEKQLALINAQYASPLGADKYARAGTGSVTGNTREERLAGQNAVDNSLQFTLHDKLAAGDLTSADAGNLRAVIDALLQREQVDRDVDRLSPGAFSLEGMRDRRAWEQTRLQFENALSRLEGGAEGSSRVGGVRSPAEGTTGGSTTHAVNVSLGGRRTTVNTASAADSEALTSVFRQLEEAAGRAS